MAACWFDIITSVNIALFDATVVKRLVATGSDSSLTSPKQPVYSKLKPKTLHWLPVTVVKLIAPSSSHRLGKESRDLQLTPKNDTAYERKKIRCEAESETQMFVARLQMHMRSKDFRLGPNTGPLKVQSVQWLRVAGQWRALICCWNINKYVNLDLLALALLMAEF